jgi:hypothetical protein
MAGQACSPGVTRPRSIWAEWPVAASQSQVCPYARCCSRATRSTLPGDYCVSLTAPSEALQGRGNRSRHIARTGTKANAMVIYHTAGKVYGRRQPIRTHVFIVVGEHSKLFQGVLSKSPTALCWSCWYCNISSAQWYGRLQALPIAYG